MHFKDIMIMVLSTFSLIKKVPSISTMCKDLQCIQVKKIFTVFFRLNKSLHMFETHRAFLN